MAGVNCQAMPGFLDHLSQQPLPYNNWRQSIDFVCFVIFVRFWICNWYLWWQQCFCYCCVLDLEKALATLCVFCLVRYCPQHALPFTRPELRPLFVLFLPQRPRYCRRAGREGNYFWKVVKFFIIFDRSVFVAFFYMFRVVGGQGEFESFPKNFLSGGGIWYNICNICDWLAMLLLQHGMLNMLMLMEVTASL